MKQKIVLIAAIAAGLLAAVLTRFYLSSKDSEIAAMKSRFAERYGVMEVLCYAENVPSGTIISKSHLGTKNVFGIAQHLHYAVSLCEARLHCRDFGILG